MLILIFSTLIMTGQTLARDNARYTYGAYQGRAAEIRDDFEVDPKETFFRQMRALESGSKPAQIEEYGDVPKPGGFKSYYPYIYENNGPPNRHQRSLYYDNLPFFTQPRSDEQDIRRKYKRNVEQTLQLPSLDSSVAGLPPGHEYIRGTSSNKDIVSENYAKSIIEEVTRTAAIAGRLPPFEFIPGNGASKDVTAQKAALEVSTEISKPDLKTSFGLPLEIAILDPENITGSNETKIVTLPPPLVVQAAPQLEPANILAINDFIRFRRHADARRMASVKGEEQSERDSADLEIEARDSVAEESNLRSKREKVQRVARMLMAPSDSNGDTNREPRGPTKEQWVKQQYPVQTSSGRSSSNPYEDAQASSSEGIHAPRVHFVTQRRSESAPQPTYRYYEREGRGFDEPKLLQRENSREAERDVYPREQRRYNNPPPNYYPVFHPYHPRDMRDMRDMRDVRDMRDMRDMRDLRNIRDMRDEDIRDRRFEYKRDPYEYERMPTLYSNKNRRIIYYATLPDVIRTPAKVDVPDSQNYRGRYEDRYIPSPSLTATRSDLHLYRKPYPLPKSRYEEIERPKSAYPLKVTTDVNVREIKKNPERRIYSEADRRYAFKAPDYQSENERYGRHI